MWTDLALTVYEYRWFIGGVGFIMAVTGLAGIAMQRYGTLGPDPVLPPVVHVEHPLAHEDVALITRRPDSDTGVVPRIPGGTPDESALTVRIPPYAPTWNAAREWPRFTDAPTETMPVLRVLDGPPPAVTAALAGPVCPTCGGPFGNCSCYGKPGDDCPLTTDTIRIPTTGDTPDYDAQRRGDTCDLGAKTQKIRAVAS